MASIEELITDSQQLVGQGQDVERNLASSNQHLKSGSTKIYALTQPSRTGMNASAQVNQAADKIDASIRHIKKLEEQLNEFIRQRHE